MNTHHSSFSHVNDKKKIVVLISDIRGFTSMSEKYPDIALVRMLNRYFEVMNRIIINEHNGYVDKYMGDSIMAVFGMNDEEWIISNAIECAIKMQIAMDGINQVNSTLGMPELFMGIGISYGEAVIADLGSSLYSERTVIGDIVNLASRIEAFSLRGQVLLSEAAYLHVKEFVICGEKHTAFVKGKEKSIEFYDLQSTKIDKRLDVPQRDVRKTQRVDVRLSFNFQLLDSKHILDKKYDADTVDISYEGLLAQIYHPIALFSEIKLKLFLLNNQSSEIYAKVVRVREDENHNLFVHVEFTSIDEVSRHQLHLFIDSIIQA